MLPKPASRLLLFTLAGLSCTMAGPVNNQSSSVGTNFDGPPPPPYKGSINLSWDPWVIVASTQGNSPNDAKDMWGTAGPNSQIMFADDSWGNTSTFNIFGYEVDGPWDSIGWNVYGNGTTPEWTEVLNPYTLVTRGACQISVSGDSFDQPVNISVSTPAPWVTPSTAPGVAINCTLLWQLPAQA